MFKFLFWILKSHYRQYHSLKIKVEVYYFGFWILDSEIINSEKYTLPLNKNILPCISGEGVTTNDVFVVELPGGGLEDCLTSWGVAGNSSGGRTARTTGTTGVAQTI